MNNILNNDLQDIEKLVELTKQQGLHFLNNINERPTSSNVKPQAFNELCTEGFGGVNALKAFNERLEPLMVGSPGPRYWGFVTGGSTPASIMGDMLATFYDQNTQSVNGQGDVSAFIELETINLLLDLLGLPNDFLGGFVTGATMSNFTCLAVARQWIGKHFDIDIAKDGVIKGIKILSALPHSSAIKSLAMLGIGSNNVLKIKVAEGNREAIDIVDLISNIEQWKDEPFILIASAGTVNTVDFDDFQQIAELKKKYNFWLHIDAAFGAFAACSPKYKYLLKGWEVADSITIDCHKWLNVPYESAFFLVKEQHKNLQVETFQNTNAPYLGNASENFSYLNFLPENSRRLKALPAWFTLNAYGKNGYRDIVENSVYMANIFAQYIEQSGWLLLQAPVRLNNVVFTLNGANKQDLLQGFLRDINSTGKVFMTPSVYNGQKGIRASFVNWRTTEKDIELVINEIEKLKR
jgi:glutamate/tyrosine decarboxylase-like PLP-dependent enzyme